MFYHNTNFKGGSVFRGRVINLQKIKVIIIDITKVVLKGERIYLKIPSCSDF